MAKRRHTKRSNKRKVVQGFAAGLKEKPVRAVGKF